MTLKPGRYQTRNVRIVELIEAFDREKTISPGNTQMVRVWRGNLLKADAKTVDSQHEWEETNHPLAMGTYVSPGKAEGVSNEFDLISFIGERAA
jgi:hypothetical protein